MPKRDMTLEAWVRVDKAMQWGGIIGALQDNGTYEKGWLLGFRGSSFCFALNTEGSDKLTYLTAPTAFERGRWYHLAGTYDGTTQRLFVDGKQVAQATEQSGAIVYPPKTWLEIGAYHDDDEHFMMNGRLYEVRVLGQTLSAEALSARHLAKRELFPEPVKPAEPLVIAFGPFVDWVDRSTATITWEVDQSMQGKLRWSMPSGQSAILKTDRLAKRHTVKVTNLVREGEYKYQILSDDPELKSKTYKFDSSFYYRLPRVTFGKAETTDAGRVRNAVKQMLDLAKRRAGYCLVLGGVDGSLALELVRQSDFQVIVLDDRPEVIRKVRSNLDAAGVYGAGTVDAGCIEIAADLTDHLRPVVEYNHLKIGLPNQLQRKTAIDSPEHEAVAGPPLGQVEHLLHGVSHAAGIGGLRFAKRHPRQPIIKRGIKLVSLTFKFRVVGEDLVLVLPFAYKVGNLDGVALGQAVCFQNRRLPARHRPAQFPLHGLIDLPSDGRRRAIHPVHKRPERDDQRLRRFYWFRKQFALGQMPRTQRLRRQRLAKHAHLIQPAVHHEVLVVIVIRANLQPCFRWINDRPALLGRLRHLFAIHEQPLRCAIVRTGKMIPAAALKRRRRSQVGQLVAALGVQRETETAPAKPKQPALLIGAIVLQRTDDPTPLHSLVDAHPCLERHVPLGHIDRGNIRCHLQSRAVPGELHVCRCRRIGKRHRATQSLRDGIRPDDSADNFPLQSIWREEPMTQHRFLSPGNTAAANHK